MYLTDIADLAKANAAFLETFPKDAPARITIAVQPQAAERIRLTADCRPLSDDCEDSMLTRRNFFGRLSTLPLVGGFIGAAARAAAAPPRPPPRRPRATSSRSSASGRSSTPPAPSPT